MIRFSIFGTITALAIFLSAVPNLAASSAAPVALNRDILVEGPLIKLSDIFIGLDPASRFADTPVAKTPAPGQSVELDAHWLAALAKAYDIDWQPRSHYDTATVERSSRTIEEPRIRALVLEALAERGHSGDLQLHFDQTNPRIILPREAPDDLLMGAFTYDERSGRFFAHLRVPNGDGDASRLKLTGMAQKVTKIPVLRHRLSVNEPIEQGDIEWLAVPAKGLGSNTVLDPSELVGMSPRRTIAPGKPIRAGDLRLPVLVEKSSIVTIELKTNRMRLSVQGRAMEAGAKGQGIRVMNTQSKRVVTAIVLDENTVEVATVDAATGIN